MKFLVVSETPRLACRSWKKSSPRASTWSAIRTAAGFGVRTKRALASASSPPAAVAHRSASGGRAGPAWAPRPGAVAADRARTGRCGRACGRLQPNQSVALAGGVRARRSGGTGPAAARPEQSATRAPGLAGAGRDRGAPAHVLERQAHLGRAASARDRPGQSLLDRAALRRPRDCPAVARPRARAAL